MQRSEGLVLEGVWAGYGAREVLRGVSLEVPPGRLTGVIGPNGSGKTTLVRVASRALRPRAGRVLVQGVDPYRIPARRAAALVAVVPQDVAPAFPYTVLELVTMGRSPYQPAWGGSDAEDWAAVRRAMAATNVQHFADRPIQDLSGGERQRVVLAQALAQDTPVLLLDEPTTHLDVRHVSEVIALVRSLAVDEGRAVMGVFHDLNLASAWCDRLLVFSGGTVVAEGPPERVLTRTLLAEVFGVEAEMVANPSTGRPSFLPTPAAPIRPPGGSRRAHVVGGAGRGAGAMRFLAERGFEVSAGVLHAGDTDAAVAERLGVLRVTVPPFSTIDERSALDCLELMRRADLLVVCDAPYGPANAENLRLALRAAEGGVRTVLLGGTPMAERDFTGGEAAALWERLTERASTAGSIEDLQHAVAEVLTGR